MGKAHKEKVDKSYYKVRRQDKEELSNSMASIEAWAEQIAGISSLYNQRCLVNNNNDDMDAKLKEITAAAIGDLRSAFGKLAEGESMLDEWLAQHKTSFLGKLLPFF